MDGAASTTSRDSEEEWWQPYLQGAKYWSGNRADFDARKLFNNDSFADVTIKYAGKEIRAHRLILCLRSEYFDKILGTATKTKESMSGVIHLEDDNEEAIDDMLHWLYSFEYFPSFDLKVMKNLDEDDWERHLDGAIIAHKYGIASMEKYAIGVCTCAIETFAEDLDAVRLAKRALDYPDKGAILADYIPHFSHGRFPELFKDDRFRRLLARYPETRQQLIDENFTELIKTEEFRAHLKADGELALRYIDRLMESEQDESEEKKGKKKRKLLK